MSTSPLSSEEIRAAAEAHRELGPEFSDAVVESFLEKVDREIGARIDARLASSPRIRRPLGRSTLAQRRSLQIGLWSGAAVAGIPLTGLIVLLNGSAAMRADWHQWLLGTWLLIVVLYVAANSARQSRSPERKDR